MHLPAISAKIDQRSMITTPTPLNESRFSLDASGVAGFFGGHEAISAMATVHIQRGRRWLGWYNSPGSFQIARQYGLIAKSMVFTGVFPGARTDPAKLFGFDGCPGPKFIAIASGTRMENTSHLASVLMKHCAAIAEIQKFDGRDGPGVDVTIVKLDVIPEKLVSAERISDWHTPVFSVIPIAISLAACISSGIYRDWFSFSLILWGMLSNGISCLIIGFGSLYFTHHIPSAGCPRGDGILGSGQEFIVLQGPEGAINCLTLGRFLIKFPSEHYYEYIGYCSVLLTIQFLAQLFLIPQGSLFGQIMFISSLAASWIYNSCLSAFDGERIQQQILLDEVLGKPSLKKYHLTTRGSALVFMLCVLSPVNPHKILNDYLPDNEVWGKWKEEVARRIGAKEKLHFTDADCNLPEFDADQKALLHTLYRDAEVAYDGFMSLNCDTC